MARLRASPTEVAFRISASTLSIPQARFTAVGRVFRSISAACATSLLNRSGSVSLLVAAARATPMAPATPSAGAPLIASRRIASASRSTVVHRTTS